MSAALDPRYAVRVPPTSLHRLFASIVLGGAALGCAATHELTPDAGPDGGADAGVDASRDAGVDASRDAGVDASRDAGVDAPSPCDCGTCVPGSPGCDDDGCAPCIF